MHKLLDNQVSLRYSKMLKCRHYSNASKCTEFEEYKKCVFPPLGEMDWTQVAHGGGGGGGGICMGNFFILKLGEIYPKPFR
jgi:hypothetical protein